MLIPQELQLSRYHPISCILNDLDRLLHLLRIYIGKGKIMGKGGIEESWKDNECDNWKQGRYRKIGCTNIVWIQQERREEINKEYVIQKSPCLFRLAGRFYLVICLKTYLFFTVIFCSMKINAYLCSIKITIEPAATDKRH